MNLLINEIFGPTIQGEGPDIGQPVFFLRFQGCPVQCPGCDTAYTWNGTESGQKRQIEDLKRQMEDLLDKHPNCGIIVSGGEPLIHYQNESLRGLFSALSDRTWLGLETSGFIGPKSIREVGGKKLHQWSQFLDCFKTVCVSPKITDCLHGEGWTDEQLLVNIREFIHYQSSSDHDPVVFKFVVKTPEDVLKVTQVVQELHLTEWCIPVYLMAYGVESQEIIDSCRTLIPFLAETGFILSPRLHSILWGKQRGV